MSRPARLWTIPLAALVLLTGCQADILPYAQEIENMVLMRTIGVDTGAEGGVLVTASSGVQSKGADKGEEPPVAVSGEAETISGALLTMQAGGASYLFYGHVGHLLLGEDLARQGTAPALDYVLRDIEMRLDTNLYLVKGDRAGQAIAAVNKGGSSSADQLDAMEEDVSRISYSAPRTVGQTLSDLAETHAACVPALTVTDAEEPLLRTAGYGVLKDGVLAAWTEDGESRGINLLQGEVDADIVELSLPDGGTAALRVVGAKAAVRPVFQGNILTGLEIRCKVDANLAEAPPGLDLREQEILLPLEEALAGVEGARVRAALELSQRLDADFLHLEKRAGCAAPWAWHAIREQWNLPQLDLDLLVEANIVRSYDVDR